MTDIQGATLDNPDALPSQAQNQTAESIGWMGTVDQVPAYERYRAIGPEGRDVARWWNHDKRN